MCEAETHKKLSYVRTSVEREKIQNGRPMWFIFFIHIAKLFFLVAVFDVENENFFQENIWV